jgi:hypothetical protein
MILPDIGEDEAGSRIEQALRHAEADAARAAGDEGGLSGDLHAHSPVVRSSRWRWAANPPPSLPHRATRRQARPLLRRIHPHRDRCEYALPAASRAARLAR